MRSGDLHCHVVHTYFLESMSASRHAKQRHGARVMNELN
jgi:hypothetical protein